MELQKFTPKPRSLSEIQDSAKKQQATIDNRGKSPEYLGSFNFDRIRLKVDRKCEGVNWKKEKMTTAQIEEHKKLKPHIVNAVVLQEHPYVVSDEPFREDSLPVLMVHEVKLTHPSFSQDPRFQTKKIYFVSSETYTYEPDQTLRMLGEFAGQKRYEGIVKITARNYSAINVLDTTKRFGNVKTDEKDSTGKYIYKVAELNPMRKWLLLDLDNDFDVALRNSFLEQYESNGTLKHWKITLSRGASSMDKYGNLETKCLTRPEFLTEEEIASYRVPEGEEIKGHDGNPLPADWRTTPIDFFDMFKPITPEQAEAFRDYIESLVGA